MCCFAIAGTFAAYHALYWSLCMQSGCIYTAYILTMYLKFPAFAAERTLDDVTYDVVMHALLHNMSAHQRWCMHAVCQEQQTFDAGMHSRSCCMIRPYLHLICLCAPKSCCVFELFKARSLLNYVSAVCVLATVEGYLLSYILISSEYAFVLQITQASMCANYWSLPLLLCQQLLTFQPCFSLHCTSQAPFRFLFQMLSMSRRGCRTGTWSSIWHQSQNQALSLSALLYIVFFASSFLLGQR